MSQPVANHRTQSARRLTWILCAAVLCCAGVSQADTVFFKDGSKLDGLVGRPNADTIIIQLSSGRMTFAYADVARIEKNDKRNETAKVVSLAAKRHAASLRERTGLNRKQRDEVRRAIEPLWSPDEATRNAARAQLVEMGGKMDVYKFIEASLPYTKGEVVPELMQVLVTMDPQRSAPVLERRAMDVDPRNRSKALALMANYDGPVNERTLARGIVDPEPSVQAAAAKALAQTAGKRATPVLLEGLKSNDPRVRNACGAALTEAWQLKADGTEPASASEWRDFWAARSGSVDKAISANGLEPLVTEEELAEVSNDHDE
ncbi:MAG: hypothetical protein GWP08_02125 [Nitrospiraceae bacterium]|nr:hypothetical protein [Nitrospiraceae bacterium]